MGRVVGDTSIAGVPTGPAADFPLLPGIQHVSDGLLDQLPIGIAIFDREGRLVRYNRSASELWGRALETGGAAGLIDLPAEALRTGASLRGKEITFERENGTRVFLNANADPLLDDHGDITGVVVCFTDVTALKLQQEKQERTARQLLDALPVALYTTDAEGRITYFNQAAAEFWGRRPELNREQWCGSFRLYHSGGIPLAPGDCPMAISIRYGLPLRGVEAIAERPDGTRVPFLSLPTPLRDSDGRLTGAVNVLLDISDRKRSEERQRTLMSVLNHRVKNTLATVQALASQTIRGRGVKRDVRAKFVERLFALSRAHDLLTREGWESADLLSVVQEVLAPHHGRIEVHGQTTRISPKTTVALSMVLQELASNAVRHGALSVRGGKVTVALTIEPTKGSSRMILNWRETSGPPVVEPERRGFGLLLIDRSITQELSGAAEIAFEPQGLHCTLSVPIAGEDNSARVQQAAPSPPAPEDVSTAA